MCGRFTLTASAEALQEVFPLFDLEGLSPRYNIAPTQAVVAVRRLPQSARPEFVCLRWGLVPHWADDSKIGYRLINARAESAASKPAFRSAFRQRRCLVLADGFYEWQKIQSGDGRRTPKTGAKQPFYIRLKEGKPFAFAGLWEHWDKGDTAIDSCTILTTDANDLMRPLHDRMPVILDPALYDRWLDPALQQPAEVQALLRPIPAEAMTAFPVSTHVNNPRNEDAACLNRVG